MPNDGVAKVAEIIKDIRIAMLTTVDDDGRLVSRPMAVQEVEFDGDLWFLTGGDAPMLEQLRRDPRTNVSFTSNGSWLSLAGDAELLQDQARTEELWSTGLDAWFPDGPTTPGLTLIKIHADTAEYWDAPGGRVITLISYVKARLTGQRTDLGENEVVDL